MAAAKLRVIASSQVLQSKLHNTDFQRLVSTAAASSYHNINRPGKCSVCTTQTLSGCRINLRTFATSKVAGSQQGHDAEGPTTHFGFKTVSEKQKEEQVYQVFKNVAEKYDLMNDVMSAGVHRLWKDEFIRKLAPQPGTRLLDVAGGTGDIAFRFMNYVKKCDNPDLLESHVTVCDINDHMLNVGKQRALEYGFNSGMDWVQGNAESLPFENSSYDAFTIAFGIRNCTHVKKVVAEAYRVLKPGGRFMCLEFSRVRNPLLRAVYDQYSFQVIPVLGHVIAQDWNSYQYLVESIRKFPDQETFASWIEEAGFQEVTSTDMTFGVVAIHSGFKCT